MRFVAAILIGTVAALLIGLAIDIVWPENGFWGTVAGVTLALFFIPNYFFAKAR